MFALETPWWEIVLRVTLIYVTLLALVRVSGKRQLGQLAPMDLLTILLLAQTVGPALVGGDHTAAAGIIAAATLIGLTVINSWATFRWQSFEAISEGSPSILIRDGRIDAGVMHAERITQQEIDTALHREGLHSVDDVARGIIEPDGELTFLVRHRRQ